MIPVEVVYSPAPRQVDAVTLSLPEGSTVGQALQASGLPQRHGLDPATLTLSVWGRRQPPETVLRERDRVELCRPLRCDPKESRRQRYRARPPVRARGTGAR